MKFSWLFVFSALFAFGLSPAVAQDEAAPNRQPVKVVADQRWVVSTPAGTGNIPLYVSRDWSQPQAGVTRVVLIFHGRLRDADVYLQSASQALSATGDAGQSTLLVVPQFLADADVTAHGLPATMLHWGFESWMGGEFAHGPAPISSFDVIDSLLKRLADQRQFPNLKQVVLAGHSGGAQVVQRYAVVGRAGDALIKQGIAVRYVAANPSSYLYFSRDRPDGLGKFVPLADAKCPDFNRWKYGWDNAPAYALATPPSALETRYIERDVVYLLGGADTNPNHPALDKSCAAETQGAYRLSRGLAYASYLTQRHPDHHPRVVQVPGVGHDADRMFNSVCGLDALFDTGRCERLKH